MSIYAIGDLHLSLAQNKTMDKFGENWVNHTAKIQKNWLNLITEHDTVLIPGDISWAMYLRDARADLDFLASLPGKKVLLCGNHDFWWDSVAKLRSQFPALVFLQNDSCFVGDYCICGTRGWLVPGDPNFSQADIKIFNRERNRLRLSLEHGIQQGAKKIILFLHFPPSDAQHSITGFMEIIKEYPIVHVVYGHLHGQESFLTAITGEVQGIQYHLVSADYIQFMPKFITKDLSEISKTNPPSD